MGGAFNIRMHEKCKRKGVCFIRKKKYTTSERVKIMRVSRRASPCKEENGCFDQTMLRCKICCEIKEIKSGNYYLVERGFPN